MKRLAEIFRTLFLIFIVGVMMIQNAFPHIEHIHDELFEHLDSINTDSHTSLHCHNYDLTHDNEEEEHSKKKIDLFYLLLELHLHDGTSHDMHASKVIKAPSIDFIIPIFFSIKTKLDDDESFTNYNIKEVFALFDDPYLDCFSFRGPPMLDL